MARFTALVRSPLPPAEAFAYMADLSNFAQWDPGVVSSTQVQGNGIELGAAYDVEVKGVAGNITMRYHITEIDQPDHLVAKAETSLLTSVDTVTVEADGDGSLVTYDAVLTMGGPFGVLGLFDPLLQQAFNRIGEKAAAGMVDALDGERVTQPA
jgi:carbon monoxide dehydrogenase subunit G